MASPPRSHQSASIRAALDRTGFAILPSLLSPPQIQALRQACAHITALARSGSWPHVRTLPDQFPPWPRADPSTPPSPPPNGIWGVQHLLHPAAPGRAVVGAGAYFSRAIADAVCEIVGVRCGFDSAPGSCGNGEGKEGEEGREEEEEKEGLVMELCNLLVRPDADFELRWHRDDVPPDVTREEEVARLGLVGDGRDDRGETRMKKAEYTHAQWNLALFPDSSLVVVPGSHARARTEAERQAGPYDELEGATAVKLMPGDAVFYDNNILHRGIYRADTERLTLHGSMGRSGRGEERARNVLQHGVGEWIGLPEASFAGLDEFEAGKGRWAEGMRRRLIEMGRGREVEYSQPN